jgi:soluble lytic murein transglycosylase
MGAAGLLGPLLGAPQPDLDATARLALGRALLTGGQARAALDILSDLQQLHPDSEVADRAIFYSGIAWEALGDHRSAADAFRSLAQRHPEIAAYLEIRAAANLRDADAFEEAVALAERAAAHAPTRRAAVAALEEIRAVAQQRGDHTAVINVTSRLLELATLPFYRAELLYTRSTAQRALGQPGAVEGFLAVVTNTPESPFAPAALSALDQLGHGDAVTAEQRGLISFFSGRYAEAIETFTQVLAVDPGNDLAWYYRALSRLRASDTEGAASELAELAEQLPASPFGPEALLTAGKLHEYAGRHAEAHLAYRRVADQFPGTPQAAEARFRIGLLAYAERDLAAATRLWSEAVVHDARPARVAFWLGKARAAIGDRHGAVEWWKAARRFDPDGFYGLRASELLASRSQPLVHTATIDPAPFITTPQEERELDSWFLAIGSNRQATRDRLVSEPGYQRLSALLELEMHVEAGWEFDALVSQLGSDPAALASLARLLSERGETALAYRAAVQLQSHLEASALPRVLMRCLYPLPFPEVLLPAASVWDVDPLLLAALIRQESAFDPRARSPADARGLTQVLPSTGQGIAAALRRSDWHPDDLYRPVVSIEFGAFYLSRRLAHYGNALYPALAAYNAGQNAVDGWVRGIGLADPDLFVERIPFPETREYVQRVYANYLNYQRLYRSLSP